MNRGTIAAAALGIVSAGLVALAIDLSACTPPPLPPNSPLPGDVLAEAQCVAGKLESGVSDVNALVLCVGGDFKILSDILDWLTAHPSFVAKCKPETLVRLHQSAVDELVKREHLPPAPSAMAAPSPAPVKP